ncbi:MULTISPECIES: extracellular solute-binding protein [Actinomadura]|uniref:N,N'-diacetylchitobiose transport system substrate-binding protein n=1 Tax=Actinomadura madurae TaxID=1993 RepID=A0A1I4WGX9_9ACTN|nr:extracellular solute-binding protein [Actinomadura madurae]SFN12665.1 N,N'-diacetylchitobiose transport system substrate-binding protein [Actinomadura madurae]SPT63147.1 Probable ABC transporter-binding protein DR_1438 precursor [Actinomadura madurae]
MRYIKVAAAAAAIALAATACGGDSKDDEAGGGKDPAQLKVWMMGDGTPEQTKLLDGVEAEFKQKHPNTDVQIKYVPWAQVATTFQKAAAGGEGPDVTELGNTDVQSHVEQGSLADITDEFGGWADGKTLNKTALANDQADGKTYAVPWYGGVRGVWYRTDWFQELGIQQPKTWADLTAAAKKVQDSKKVPGIGIPSDQTNALLSFIWGNGGDVAAKQGEEWKGQLDQPQAVEAVKYYAGLVTTEKVAPEKYVGKNELEGPQRDFALGKLGMYVDGSWALKEMTKISEKNADKWGVFPIPSKAGGNAPVMAGGSDLAVWNDSKAKDAAFDYITVLNNAKNAKAWADYSGFSSMRSDVTFTDPKLEIFTQIAGNTKFPPISAGWGEFEQAKKVLPNAVKAVMQGKSAEEEMKKANEQANTLLNP